MDPKTIAVLIVVALIVAFFAWKGRRGSGSGGGGGRGDDIDQHRR